MKEDLRRYDLPSSRILLRSLRCQEARLKKLVGEKSEASEELRDRVQAMIRDLVVIRLLEDRQVLKPFHLCGGKRSRPLQGGEAAARLRELNEWAGWEVFFPEVWEDPCPGSELAELYRELHLSRFWPNPPGSMPVEALGALWEERLPTARRTGVYYTPRRIVNLILSWVLPEVLGKKELQPLRILDPACGAGYFLLEAFRRLAAAERESQARAALFSPLVRGESGELVLDPARRMELIQEHLFGVDLDLQALDLARRALWIEVVADTPAFLRPAVRSEALFTNLREGDSLIEEGLPLQPNLFESRPLPVLKPFRWEDREQGFGAVMAAAGFHVIVGNPPWVSLKGRHRQSLYSPEIAEYLIRKYEADTYRPNVVEFFIRRAISLLAEGGWHSFVVPDRIAENEQFEPLRQFMLAQGEILRLHFREYFPGVAADTLIYVFRKRRGSSRTPKIRVSDVSGGEMSVPQSFWLKPGTRFPRRREPEAVEEIVRKVEMLGRRRLADFLETGVGFIARPGLITPARESARQQEVIKGEHVAPYRRVGQAFFEFRIENLAGGTRSLLKLAHPERILIRKTGARLIAALDKSTALPEQSLYFAFRRGRRLDRLYDLNFFVALLNSRLLSFYFRQCKITNRATTPQIKKIHLDSLPVRPINFQDPGMRTLHDQLAEAAQARASSTDPQESRSLDDRIDQLVAALYELTAEEQSLIGRQMKPGWE